MVESDAMGAAAFLFPGQGSQQVGMGRDLHAAYAEARAVFEAVDRALDAPLTRLLFEGPDEELRLTANTQPAVLAASLAAWAVLERRGAQPAWVAGHSLGEYSALVAAGALAAPDAAVLVRKRGRYMQEAVPVGEGAMAAIIGLDTPEVEAACREAAGGQVVSPANLNGAGQVVISGDTAAVDRACREARNRGARKTVPLPVSAPFHCALMEPAARRLSADLDAQPFADLRFPCVSNVDARPRTKGPDVREALRAQVTAPVRWEETLLYLKEQGARFLVEVGPGNVLAGLARRVSKDWTVLGAGDVASIETTCSTLGLCPGAGRTP